MTPAHALPVIPTTLASRPLPHPAGSEAHALAYLGTTHPAGPGVHALPSPADVEMVGVANARGVVEVVVLATPGALDADATGYMRRWWQRKWGALARRAGLALVRAADLR